MRNIGTVFMRVNGYRQQLSGGPWWVPMVPGVVLVLFALIALLNPLMLARLFGYAIGIGMLFGGGTLLLQGWRMRQIQMKSGDDVTYYED